ncbi:MAG: response regulator receiver [Elusimicrobia bacterium]|nr:MAG: response regulator receiver [Elusimicrobiota bacterium]KAF0154206.1 MAG: response regulator receiver [Elusimicrobiota bacterium]
MNRLLVADDDIVFQKLVTRLFSGTGWEVAAVADGAAALAEARRVTPDAIILDLNMPGVGGRETLLAIRRRAAMNRVPVIIVSGLDSAEEKAADLGLGADDYVTKPFDPAELLARVESAVKRTRRNINSNPLTGLPGAPAIEEAAARRIKAGVAFAFAYIDIDNFKAYNDRYGYFNGDNVIKTVAALLEDLAAGEFAGHIGGDDFVLVSTPGMAVRVAEELTRRFDALAPGFYNLEDRERGCITTRDRQGNEHDFPLVSLSIAVVTNERREISHYARLADLSSEIKSYLKGLPGRKGSAWLKDRRGDAAKEA